MQGTESAVTYVRFLPFYMHCLPVITMVLKYLCHALP